MNYLLAEDEYNVIDETRRQLRLVADLLVNILDGDDKPIHIRSGDLSEFLSQRVRDLSDILDSVDNRYHQSRNSPRMSPFDWSALIRMVSGGPTSFSADDAQRIDHRLGVEAQLDPNMGLVVDAWSSAVKKAHQAVIADQGATQQSAASGKKRSRVAKAVAGAMA